MMFLLISYQTILFNNKTCFNGERFPILIYDIGSAPITKYYPIHRLHVSKS